MQTSDFIGQLIEAALPVLQTAVLALVTWASAEAAKFIRQRVKNEAVASGLERLNETVADVVLELEQTMVKELKAATSEDSPGGKAITREEAEDIKLEALARVKALIGEDGVKRLLFVLGMTDESALDALIATKVEAAVVRHTK